VTAYLVGMSQTALRNKYLQPMWSGHSSAAQQLMRRLNQKRDDPFIELRIEGETYTLSEGHIVTEELPVTAYRLNTSGSR
jgi:hypothetical protein